jgi:hypothetical protein
MINSRHDCFKAYSGPVFKCIEKEVYKQEAFIKKIPVSERPTYIMNLLGKVTGTVISTDHNAFESCFVRQLQEACEMQLYDYLTSQLPIHDEFMRAIRTAKLEDNDVRYKSFNASVPATRMSGEMDTSLGNGFSNHMAILFCCAEVGSLSVECVVEGDDGLTVVTGPVPTSEHFRRIGMNVRLEVHESIGEASFCGLVFDQEDRILVRDPLRVLVDFGWTEARYRCARDRKKRALLRAKSLSMLYQFAGCPILTNLGLYGLRITDDIGFYDLYKVVNSKGITEYQRRVLLEAIEKTSESWDKKPGVKTRVLVEKLFGISIEAQLKYEKYLDGLNELQPLDPRFLDVLMPEDWHEYDEKYTARVSNRNTEAIFISLTNPIKVPPNVNETYWIPRKFKKRQKEQFGLK